MHYSYLLQGVPQEELLAVSLDLGSLQAVDTDWLRVADW